MKLNLSNWREQTIEIWPKEEAIEMSMSHTLDITKGGDEIPWFHTFGFPNTLRSK